jgi:hypothetical protein
MFSNEIHTPRKSPSKRTDYTPSFSVNAGQFAEVLDVSGYQRDALEVAVAGDDHEAAESATHQTYEQLAGKDAGNFTLKNGGDLRFVFLALASGYSLDDVRSEIDPSLYNEIKGDLERLNSEEVFDALKENFDVFSDEVLEEEEFESAVFGASLVNFPKQIRKRSVPQSLLPKLSRLAKPDSISSFRTKRV